MTRLPILTLVLGSFLAGAALMFTAPHFVADAHAGKNKVEFVAPPIREGTNPTKWEYFKARSSVQNLQAMGEQGWELVGIHQDSFQYVFKRALP